MKKIKKATSILEAMIVMLIISTGIIGLYNIFNESQKLSNTTKNRIEAIEIAREGIEAVKNIRDTNWLMFGGDTKNCWNTYDYNSTCVSATNTDISTGNYKLIIKSNNKWTLDPKGSDITYTNSDYRESAEIYKDINGYYSQGTILGNKIVNTNLIKIKPLFTRRINISYSGSIVVPRSDNPIMIVKSIVEWSDNSRNGINNVTLTSILTNWK